MATLATSTQEERARAPRACPMSALAMVCAVNSKRRKMWQASLKETRVDGKAKRVLKRCFVDGCDRLQRSKGLCKAHGGGRRCTVEGCKNSDQGGGSCIRHGGGVRCSVDGCKNGAQRRSVCKAHGGGDICKAKVPKVKVPKVKTPEVKTPEEKMLKGKTHASDASTVATPGIPSYVQGFLKEKCQDDLQSCMADEAAAEDDGYLRDKNTEHVLPSLQTVRDDRTAANSSPHTVMACKPEAESVSPTGKACVISKWPLRESVTPTETASSNDDNTNCYTSVAALLLSLQAQDHE